MPKGQLTIKISDADVRTVKFDSFVIFPSFSVDLNTGTSTDVIPNNDGRFRLILTKCLYFPQYNAICVLDSPFFVKMFDGQLYKVQPGILKLRYAGKSGHPSDHNGLLLDFNYKTLYTKEVVANIQHPSSDQYNYQDEMYVCILEVQSQRDVTFGIDGDDAVEYEIIRLSDFSTIALNGYYGGHGFAGSPQAILDVTLDPGKYLLIVRQEEDWGGEGVIFYWKYQGETTWKVFGFDNAPGIVYTWIPDDSYVKAFEFIKTAGLDQNEPIVEYSTAYLEITNVGGLITIDGITYKPFFTNLPSIFNEKLYTEPKNAILIQDTLENKIQGFFILADGETLW